MNDLQARYSAWRSFIYLTIHIVRNYYDHRACEAKVIVNLVTWRFLISFTASSFYVMCSIFKKTIGRNCGTGDSWVDRTIQIVLDFLFVTECDSYFYKWLRIDLFSHKNVYLKRIHKNIYLHDVINHEFAAVWYVWSIIKTDFSNL